MEDLMVTINSQQKGQYVQEVNGNQLDVLTITSLGYAVDFGDQQVSQLDHG